MINIKLIPIVLMCSLLFGSCCHDDEELFSGDGINEHHEIIIVGAGISGLTCGYYLNNKDFLILEKNSSVGGRTISGAYNNLTYAKGSEYLGEPEGYLSKMIKGLGLSLKEIPSPMDSYFDGKQFYYGSDGLARYLISGSSVSTYKKFVQLLLNEYDSYEEVPDLVYNSNVKNLDYTTAQNWLSNNGIPDIYINKYNVASRGLFGASLKEISAYSFIPEAAFDFDEDDLKYVSGNFDIKNEYTNSQKESSESYTFVRGLTELTNALGDKFSNKIRLNSTVTDVRKEENHYIITYLKKDGEEKIVTCNKVVLAVPAPIALNIAPSLIQDRKREILEQIKYSSYATVALFSKSPIFDKAFDLAVPNDYFFTDIYDATWVQRYYEKTVPKEYIISVYIAPDSYTNHSINTMSDKDILNNIYKDLNRVFPNASSLVTGYDIEHFYYAYPVMTLGAYERLKELMKLNQGSFILAGDYTIYPTFESAVESGYLAGKAIK